MFLISLISFILIFTLIVVVHEFGHFFIAKLAGISVHEFSVGLGPQLFQKKLGDTIFSIRALPLGGFVRIAGLDEEEAGGVATPKTATYGDKNVFVRFLAIVFGPFMNFVFAAFLTAIIIGSIGITYPTTTIGKIEPDSPAALAGIFAGDTIYQVNGKSIQNMREAIAMIHESKGRDLYFTLKRDGKNIEKKVPPFYDKKMGTWRIGIAPGFTTEKPALFLTPFYAIRTTWERSVDICVSLFGLITGKIPITGLVGPIGIAYLSGQAFNNGWINLMAFASMLSVNLFIFNLLPIPALDGGRLFFIVLEMIFRRPVFSAEMESKIHRVGIVALLVLIALLSVKDLLRFPLPS